jgi:hypothetical protein
MTFQSSCSEVLWNSNLPTGFVSHGDRCLLVTHISTYKVREFHDCCILSYPESAPQALKRMLIILTMFLAD